MEYRDEIAELVTELNKYLLSYDARFINAIVSSQKQEPLNKTANLAPTQIIVRLDGANPSERVIKNSRFGINLYTTFNHIEGYEMALKLEACLSDLATKLNHIKVSIVEEGARPVLRTDTNYNQYYINFFMRHVAK